MIPSTVERVPEQTAEYVNEQIRRQTETNIAITAAGGLESIERRLVELDHEWDIERTLEANAATASLIGLTLGATVHRRWFVFPAVVAGFFCSMPSRAGAHPFRCSVAWDFARSRKSTTSVTR